MQSRGKKFEERFSKDFKETVADSLCYRLYDTGFGYKSIVNAGDFICYKYPICFIIDCKSSDSNTFPVDFRQYDEMIKYSNVKGLITGVV